MKIAFALLFALYICMAGYPLQRVFFTYLLCRWMPFSRYLGYLVILAMILLLTFVLDATEASVDQYGQYGGQAFYFDDLNLPNQEQRWDFKDQSGRFITTSDGAVLLGTIAPVNQSDSTVCFDCTDMLLLTFI